MNSDGYRDAICDRLYGMFDCEGCRFRCGRSTSSASYAPTEPTLIPRPGNGQSSSSSTPARSQHRSGRGLLQMARPFSTFPASMSAYRPTARGFWVQPASSGTSRSDEIFRPPSRRIAAFQRDGRAVAAVEFALIMPLLLTLYLGSVDLSQGIAADRKLASAAGASAIWSRRRATTFPRTRSTTIFPPVRPSCCPFDGGTDGDARDDGAGRHEWQCQVRVSRGRNGATGLAQGAPFVLPDDIRSLAAGSFVVVSEAWYTYQPIIGYVIDAPINLYKQFFFMPRFGEAINIV